MSQFDKKWAKQRKRFLRKRGRRRSKAADTARKQKSSFFDSDFFLFSFIIGCMMGCLALSVLSLLGFVIGMKTLVATYTISWPLVLSLTWFGLAVWAIYFFIVEDSPRRPAPAD